jgi:hypothetical protein
MQIHAKKRLRKREARPTGIKPNGSIKKPSLSIVEPISLYEIKQIIDARKNKTDAIPKYFNFILIILVSPRLMQSLVSDTGSQISQVLS